MAQSEEPRPRTFLCREARAARQTIQRLLDYWERRDLSDEEVTLSLRSALRKRLTYVSEFLGPDDGASDAIELLQEIIQVSKVSRTKLTYHEVTELLISIVASIEERLIDCDGDDTSRPRPALRSSGRQVVRSRIDDNDFNREHTQRRPSS